MAITQKEIGELVGVSQVTVSKALRGAPGVREEVRQQVLRVAQERHYQPNRLAYQMLTQRTQTLALILPALELPGMAGLAQGAILEASRSGHVLWVLLTEGRAQRQQKCLEELRGRRPDAIVAVPVEGTADADGWQFLHDDGFPLVVVGATAPLGGWAYQVRADDREGAQRAVRHLLRLGHRAIAHLGGAPHLATSQRKLEGYRQALAEARIAFRPEWVVAVEEPGEAASAMQLLRSLPNRPTAVFAASDRAAVEAIGLLAEMGEQVPQELAIVGYGDEYETAPGMRVPLTTVRVPRQELGRAAVKVALTVLRRPDYPVRDTALTTELVIRDSCGAASVVGRPEQADS